MTLREKQEQREHEFFSPFAAFSDASAGRDREEAPCDVRPIYVRDRDRILHSKAFRRLQGKTQVFLTPEGDHYRNRLTHTLEVAQTARTIAKALRLNEELTEAIALGHDLGHTPFGHAGEKALDNVCEGGFSHALQSVRVVEQLEKHGEGLNLTKEVRDGIRHHQTKGMPATLEGKIVRLSDKIAYLHHDVDDAVRGHLITEQDIPDVYTSVLGHTQKERLNTMIHDIITQSEGKNDIILSAPIEEAVWGLRAYMFEHVYVHPAVKEQEIKAIRMIEQLFVHYKKIPELLPEEYRKMMDNKESAERVICDYIAGMTDRYAVMRYREMMIPNRWEVY